MRMPFSGQILLLLAVVALIIAVRATIDHDLPKRDIEEPADSLALEQDAGKPKPEDVMEEILASQMIIQEIIEKEKPAPKSSPKKEQVKKPREVAKSAPTPQPKPYKRLEKERYEASTAEQRAMIEKGRELIDSQELDFPIIRSTSKLSPEKHMKALCRITKAHVFIYDGEKREMAYEVDIDQDKLIIPTFSDFSRFAPAVRYLSNDSYIEGFLREAQSASLSRDLRPILLMDIRADYLIVGALEKEFGSRIHDYSQFEGYYSMKDGRLYLTINKAVGSDREDQTNLAIALN